MTVVVFIPVYRGPQVRALAQVDHDDADRVSAIRWGWQDGYAVCWRTRPDRTQGMHRFVLGLDRGDAGVVHHVNGDRLDNRRENLLVFADESSHQLHHAGLRGHRVPGEAAA